jgi:hypothetical protein
VEHLPGDELKTRKERLPRRFFRRRSGGRHGRRGDRGDKKEGAGDLERAQ